VIAALERLAIPYFVTGSVVTIFYGEPRFTNDIDVVVDLVPETAVEFCRQFPEGDFYVSPEAGLEAIHHQSMFNIIQPRTGLKVNPTAVEASRPQHRGNDNARRGAPTVSRCSATVWGNFPGVGKDFRRRAARRREGSLESRDLCEIHGFVGEWLVFRLHISGQAPGGRQPVPPADSEEGSHERHASCHHYVAAEPVPHCRATADC
jgi:hypothetical protein